MALLTINRHPSATELRWFGLLNGLFFVVFGGMVSFWSGWAKAPFLVFAGVGVAFCVVYYGVRPLRRPMYLGWMHAVHPIGWVVTHVTLCLVYFAVLTPIGLFMRVIGRDPLALPFDRKAETYWTPRERATSKRYFRQF
jgi:hypothetical protein